MSAPGIPPVLIHVDPLGPHPQHIYRGGDLLEAFRYLQRGRNTGKTIIELHEDDLVPVSSFYGPILLVISG